MKFQLMVMEQLNLHILWLEDSIGFSINQSNSQNLIPLTPYYFWPCTNAWEQIKLELDAKPWFCKSEQIDILNRTASTINLWQNSRRLLPFDRLTESKEIYSENISIVGLP